ncbi:LysE family transporter [Pseudomonas sp. GD03944]|uniref:LysE family translocator n=1 Tax=Pseudomonas sp. GD03944 TaxID=2975409 RepID=UPI00244D6927|nr:LysE family transporter [Pseudomonas sp. GD03944]MDH1263300.1 LysE family transporter [Pseudomonas sp. GD03944]
MTYAYSLALITGIYLAALASPGPNFFILSQMALSQRHRDARYVALGITSGSVFWVVVSIAGLATLLSKHPWLADGVRLLGAAYLVWYGGRLLWSARQPTRRDTAVQTPELNGSRLSAYRTGLLTCVTNPKGAAFWTSAFAAVFPIGAPLWFYVATMVLIGSLSLGWHIGLSLVFGTSALRAFYLRIERTINGCAGAALVALGVQRMFSR